MVKKAITIEKKKEIVQKYESGVRVTDLANMYSMSKSTLFYYKKVRYGVLWEVRNALWVFSLFIMGEVVLTYDQPSRTN
jgi:hypothetical protein